MSYSASDLWRVGFRGDPVAFTPHELYGGSYRFDDIDRRFRTLYFAAEPETCLREVLTDFRSHAAAKRRYLERFGPAAAEDFAEHEVTASWRSQNVLVRVEIEMHGPIIDLFDVGSARRSRSGTSTYCAATASTTSTCTRSRPRGGRSRRRSPATCSTRARRRSASRPPVTVMCAWRCSKIEAHRPSSATSSS